MKHVVLCVQNLSVPQDPRVWREAKTLRAAGYRVSVICPLGPNRHRREELDGISIRRYRAPVDTTTKPAYLAETACALLFTAALVLRLHLRHRVAVLHAANPPDTYFLLGWILRPLGIRFVYDQHDHCPEMMASAWGGSPSAVGVLRVFERLSMQSASLVVTTNDSSRRAAIRQTSSPEAKVVTVRNGPESPAEGMSVALPVATGDCFRIAFAGRMGGHDGVELLLAAAAVLHRAHPGKVRVDLIGTGESTARLRSEASRLGIAELVEWPGWLDPASLRNRLLLATVAVSPDHANAYTTLSTMTKVSEYLALGLAVVAADIPENRVTAGDAALYFAAGDATALAAALASLLGNPDQCAALRARARQRAPKVVWKPSAERLTAAYRWLLDGGPPILGSQLVEG